MAEDFQKQINDHSITLERHHSELKHLSEKMDSVAEDISDIKKFVYQIHGGAKFAWIIAGAIGAFVGWVVNFILGKGATT